MEDKGIRTPSYVELSSQAYGMFVEAYAAANQRALAYMKSLYEIASKPYPTTGPEAFVSERFDRAHQIVDLTVNEMQTTGQKNVEFAEKLFAHTAKVQESATQALRGVMQTSVANLSYVKDATETSFDGFAKRVEDLQSRAGVSAN
jgi:hypothetical protein